LSRRRDLVIAWLAVAAVGTAAVVFAIASLQQDLAAYWIAGKARWLGLDPYVNYGGSNVAPRLWDGVAPYRHSRFLYPPLAAELFRLIAALPYRAAKLVFTGAAVGGWLLTARLVARRPGGRPEHARAVVVAGALFIPLTFHLERGQIDLLLLPLVLWAWSRRERVLAAGAALAFAATFKPALLGALPVVVAFGRWRWAAATIAFCGVAAIASVAISGPALVREYATVVLPRAALYGEGGNEGMLLHEDTLLAAPARSAGVRLPEKTIVADRAFSAERLITDEDGETAELDGRSYKITLPPFDAPASASLPRKLAPRSPHWASSLLPYVFAIAALAWTARRLPRRREDHDPREPGDPVVDDAELLLFTAAILACVVTSPTGWVMSFVWALPIAPLVWTSLARIRLRRQPRAILGAAWIACALSPLSGGWAAIAGSALVVAASYTADAWTEAR
jgi:glycosyl transferase family 87